MPDDLSQTSTGYVPAPRVPTAHAYHNAAQAVAHNTTTVLALNSERFDTDPNFIHDNATNNSRLTCRTAGKYDIWAQAEFATNGTGSRGLYLRVNGTTFVAATEFAASPTQATRVPTQTTWDLAVGDYVEAIAFQDSGVSLNISSGDYTPQLGMNLVSGS